MIDFAKLTKPYLIAEIGINHNGDLQIAKKLIDATFACSWDCAKFQKRDPDVSTPEHQKNVERETPWGKMTYLSYKHKIEFGKSVYDLIDMYCRSKPLDWSASVWDLESLAFLMQYDIPFLKIPSAHNQNRELIIECCKTDLPVVLSTGMSTIEEVDTVVNVLNNYARQYVLLHTNSTYPAKEEELNLLMIPKLKERYNCIVGYSGHEYGLDSTTVAVTLGAMIIERHITLDHRMWGTDQSSSVEIQGMDKLYKQITAAKKYLGNGVKQIYEGEYSIRKKLRGI